MAIHIHPSTGNPYSFESRVQALKRARALIACMHIYAVRPRPVVQFHLPINFSADFYSTLPLLKVYLLNRLIFDINCLLAIKFQN